MLWALGLNMWDGWTADERQAITHEVDIDHVGLSQFYADVARSQFWWWTLLPCIGCISAPCRYLGMRSNVRDFEAWSVASKVSITKDDIVVVGRPSHSCGPQVRPARRAFYWSERPFVHVPSVQFPSVRVLFCLQVDGGK
jgi:hypothetical protein